MKKIFVNLKRFDVPAECGGVNRVAPAKDWAKTLMSAIGDSLEDYGEEADFVFFFPEAHILSAVEYKPANVKIGCQSVFREDVVAGANFGAFTSNRPAAAAKALGCEYTLIGHCEERRDLSEISNESGGKPTHVNNVLNRAIKCAHTQGLSVLYCIGESAEQQNDWKSVLKTQLEAGLDGVTGNVTIGYEPIWAIGPGKTPPDREYIQMVAKYIKEVTANLPVVYGGGLKQDNSKMLASIDEIDGGLIALTRFTGEIGFYPDEYLEIVRMYFGR